MKRGIGSLVWLLIVGVLVVAAQHMPPWSRVADPDAVPEAGPGLMEQGSEWFRSGRQAVSGAIPGVGCEVCDGERRISCPTCHGSGQVEKVTRVRCGQCDGSGVYRSRISASRGVPCSFCNGTGQVEHRAMASCGRCAGQGSIPCPSCQETDTDGSSSR